MNFVLMPDEYPADAVRRLISEQVDGALAQLQRTDDLNEGIHEARKHFKRVRAVLRLVRGALADTTYRRENMFFRDQGRILSPVRDSVVYIETLDMLREHNCQLSAEAFARVRESLVERHKVILRTFVEDGRQLPAVIESLREAQARVQEWKLTAEGFAFFAHGLHRIYGRGHAEKKVAYAQPTTENFHAWRKRVKYLWYHAQILQPLWPGMMKALEREIDLLADLLGEEHDLAVLEESQYINALQSDSGCNRELLTALITQERARRRKAAVSIADRIYGEKADRFVKRIEGYWHVYQREAMARGL